MSSPVLVGRRDELAQLVDVTTRVAAGQTRVVTVGGDPGVGKTRLIEATADIARAAGFHVLSGGCLDVGDGTLPHIAITEALRPLWTDLDGEVLDRVVGPARPDLASLGLGPVDPGAEPDGRGAGRVLEAVRAVLDRLAAEHPVLLVVEDLQWGDQSTRDLVLYLSRNLRGPIMVVLSYRGDELHRRPALRVLLAELHRGGRCEHLPLGPLASADIAELVGEVLGYAASSELVGEIASRSEGNPFYAEELLAAHRRGSAMPATLRTVLAERIDRLGPDCGGLLGLLAVLGAPATHGLLTELLATVPADLMDALRHAVDEHVLTVGQDGQTYTFRHALLRELVYDDLLPGERQQLHARCAEVLAARTWPASPAARAAALGAVAYHWHRAGEDAPALRASMDAGRAASAAGAPGDASQHYQRVLELWDKVPDAARESGAGHDTVVREAALAAHLSGDYRTGVRLLAEAVESVDSSSDPRRASELHEAIAYCQLADGQLAQAREAYDEAARLAPRDPPGPELARALTGQSHLLLLADRNGPAITAARGALDVATSVHAPDTEGRALTVLGTALCHRGMAREGQEALARALAASSAAGDPATRIWTLGCIADAHLLAGEAALAIPVADQARTLARSIGAERNYGAWFACAAVEAKLWLGDVEGAQALAGELLELDPPAGVRRRPLLATAAIELLRGELEGAEAAVEEALDPVIPLDPVTAVDGFSLLARVATAQGQYDRARRAVESGLATHAESDNPTRVVRLCGAAVAAEADRAGAARELGLPGDAGIAAGGAGAAAGGAGAAAEMLDHLPGRDTFQALGLVTAELATAEAERSRLSGSPAEQVGRWQATLGRWERLGYPYPATYARCRLAQALLAIGNVAAAAANLKTAHRDAVRLGARGMVDATADLADRARIELVPGGVASVKARTAPGLDALTARELQVLGLLAEGMTNRSIAEHLYISEKTVSVHVTHVLAKLHVSNRGQAAAVGRRLGPGPGADAGAGAGTGTGAG